MEYSGTIHQGWNNGSYDRLQYAGNIGNISEIGDFLKDEALQEFKENSESRLDIRLDVENILLQDIQHLQKEYPDFDFSHLYKNKYPEIVEQIIIGKNKEARQIHPSFLGGIQKDSFARIQKLTNINRETLALTALNNMQERGYTFETKDFAAQELLNLWEEPFGWSLQQCSQYSNGENQNEKVFGIRDKNNTLCAALLISGNETTEWSVAKEHQGHGLITPLLFYSHAWWLENKEESLHVFARHNRSISPSVRTGIDFCKENITGILQNHVVVGETEAPEQENAGKSALGEIDGTKLRTFAIGQLNPENISQKIQEVYLNN